VGGFFGVGESGSVAAVSLGNEAIVAEEIGEVDLIVGFDRLGLSCDWLFGHRMISACEVQVMLSLFPGITPYLEAPALWSEVHSWLIVELARLLNQRITPKYRAAVEKRVYEELAGSIERYIKIREVSTGEAHLTSRAMPQDRGRGIDRCTKARSLDETLSESLLAQTETTDANA
jgi:hypothetical protein